VSAAAAAAAAAEHSTLNQRLKGTINGHRVCYHLHLPTKILHLHEAAAAKKHVQSATKTTSSSQTLSCTLQSPAEVTTRSNRQASSARHTCLPHSNNTQDGEACSCIPRFSAPAIRLFIPSQLQLCCCCYQLP
jgi:hypothetical protein